MSNNKTKLDIAREEAEFAVNKTNEAIENLGGYSGKLYEALDKIQQQFDLIRNVPSEQWIQYRELKHVRLEWKSQVERIEEEYEKLNIKNTRNGIAGASAGVAVVAFGPTLAMGIATTFGVASTGTAISALSGAAATNAALAWLGGGALAAGGGGMAAGNALLALAGPVGWAIAGVAVLTTGFFIWKAKEEINRLEDIFALISKRDVKTFQLARVEIEERIDRIIYETNKLNEALERIKTFGIDYNSMTEQQQYELGAYVNLMEASTQLLINPIMGLMPKYSEVDFKKYIDSKNNCDSTKLIFEEFGSKYKDIIISLSNLLFKIDIDENDKKLLLRTFKNNKEFLYSMNISKKDFDINILNFVSCALEYKYKCV